MFYAMMKGIEALLLNVSSHEYSSYGQKRGIFVVNSMSFLDDASRLF